MRDDGLYARQEVLGITREQRVMVIGCGGVGSWVGYFLGLAGVSHLDLFDSDTISEHNLNRLPFTPKDIGRYKSEALAGLIRSARPDVEVSANGNYDPQFHQDAMNVADSVIVSTDSHKCRRMVYDSVVKARKIARPTCPRYYELGADGMGMSVTGTPAEWVGEAEANAGYASVPVFVGPCVMAASIAVYHVLTYTELRDTFRADWVDSKLRLLAYVEV